MVAWVLLLGGYVLCLMVILWPQKEPLIKDKNKEPTTSKQLQKLDELVRKKLKIRSMDAMFAELEDLENFPATYKIVENAFTIIMIFVLSVKPFLEDILLGNPPSMLDLTVKLIAAALLGRYLPRLGLKYLTGAKHRRIKKEMKLFSEILFMSLRAKLTVRQSLEAGALATTYLKPALIRCLNVYDTDRELAINQLKEEVDMPSFDVLADLLIQAGRVGADNIHQFLEENTSLENELNNLNATSKSKILPVFGTVMLFLPFVAMMIIIFYPLAQNVTDMVKGFMF